MKLTALCFAALLSLAPLAHAQHNHSHAAAATSLTDGTIKKVDKPAGKLTIAHGTIENIGMPPMTMSFAVAEPKMLDAVKVGDKVRFAVESRKEQLTVTKLEAAR